MLRFKPLSAVPALGTNKLFAPIDPVIQVNREAAFDQADVAIGALAFFQNFFLLEARIFIFCLSGAQN